MSNFFDDDDGDETFTSNNNDQLHQQASPTRSSSAAAAANDSFFDDDWDAFLPPPPRPLQALDSTSANGSGSGGGKGRISAISNNADRNSSSSFRASSVVSSERASGSGAGVGRGRANSPDLEDIIGGDVEGQKERNIVKLIRAWSNENSAPELLVFPADLVERVVKDLAMRREDVKRWSLEQNKPEGYHVQLALFQTEILRASHVLRSYLRERLYKVEKFARYYLSDMEDAKNRMYPNELAHAQGYVEITNTYFRNGAINAMPEKMHKKLDDATLFPQPDFAQAVLVRARRNCPTVIVPDGTSMNFEKDSQHLVRYSTIRELLRLDYVELV
ncbi:hypothetical protein T439DRAFT_356602 [Meredithblackwellia eburnea MCA 4105]